MTFLTRFAPSPTGPLHLGHAYSALLASDMAKAHRGVFHLRIDDIDQSRARPHWEQQIFDDLHWLGLDWPTPVWRQSNCTEAYHNALQALWAQDLLYPCTCTRRDIQAAANAPQEGAPIHGPDGLVYPGTCRHRSKPENMPENVALRLDMLKACQCLTELSFTETGRRESQVHINQSELTTQIGDVVLSRKDMAASYHLSIVVDDADQGISHVVRGEDLFEATKIHVVLQRLLNLPSPIYRHHRLIRDEHGKRLAKRDDARAIATYRDEGRTPTDIRAMVGL